MLKIVINILFILYNLYYFKFYKKYKSLEHISELGKEDNIEGTFLFNICISIICILFEIIFSEY